MENIKCRMEILEGLTSRGDLLADDARWIFQLAPAWVEQLIAYSVV